MLQLSNSKFYSKNIKYVYQNSIVVYNANLYASVGAVVDTFYAFGGKYYIVSNKEILYTHYSAFTFL